ncbi:MAG: type II toxin-antitoxin system VapC family toxin [Rhizobiaceae bacterium]|nr:type II toxin-antitoxin system VapC family toxin [Rhizobiaceae bacterium]
MDTNVLLRFLLADDLVQHRLAVEFVQGRTPADPAFVSIVVLVETVWVLQRVKGFDAKLVADAMSALLATDDFVFEEHDVLVGIFADAALQHADVADHVIAQLGRRRGCDHTVTFDRQAARHIPSMSLLA